MTHKQVLRFFAGFFIFAFAATLVVYLARTSETTAPTTRRAPYGRPILIAAPSFKEADSRWSKDPLDGSSARVGRGGCAVVSAAMMLAHFGVGTDPGQLNHWLSTHAGYESGDLLVWDKLVEYSGGRIREIYRGPAQRDILERNLAAGIPVMAKVLVHGRISHWVLVVGTDGPEYLANDPLGPGSSRIKLSKYGDLIYALRVFRKT